MAPRRFRNVAVLMGGPGAEREVSLRSGAAVVRGLCEAGYAATAVDVRGRSVRLPGGTDGVFIALHGEFGEDGQVQRILGAMRMPYTGAGPGASLAAFDKRLSKRAFVRAAVPTPAYEVLGRNQPRSLPLPVVVKPPCQGSTIGIARVRRQSEWRRAASGALAYGDELLVEAYVPGRELTVGVVGDQVLPVVEIRAPGGWYDYGAKYTRGATRYLVPAPLDTRVARQCQRIALAAYKALRCRGLGRVDIRLNGKGAAYVLELNTIPGFTETSLLPKAARAAGIEFPELCDRIMRLART